MAIVRNFKLYLNAGRAVPLIIHANQYDSGEQWRFTLYNQDGSVYEPETGAIVGVKSDGKGIINTGAVSGGKVIITETQQMTAAAGKAIFELLIDGGSHGTANFMVLVEPKPGDNASLSDSDLSLIQEAINSTTPANIASAVSTWMGDNLTPTTPVVDASLTVSGAAADAKKTGDEINDLKSQIDDIDVDIEMTPVDVSYELASVEDIPEGGGSTGGLAFDSGYQDAQGYIHLTKNGVDLPSSSFTPFKVSVGGDAETITAINAI